jgi:ankyrin repeat protein
MKLHLTALLILAVPALSAPPPPAADLETARLAIRTKQFDQAAKLLQKDAERGSPDAQYLLGLALWNGVGVKADAAAARDSLRRAAQGGHAPAAYALAGLLATGSATDRAEASAWMGRAAAAGYAPAVALQDTHRLPLNDARMSKALTTELQIEIARAAIRNDDLALLESTGAATLANRKDAFGRTLLFEAARCDAPGAVRLLLRSGADVNATDEFGVTPLMVAAEQPDAEITRMLLAAGARPDASDRAGRTALFNAAAGNSAVQISTLLAAGVAVDHADLRGWTAFDLAVQREAPVALEALRAAGGHSTDVVPLKNSSAGIDATRPGALYRNWAPLSIAVARDDVADIRRRVAGGADLGTPTPQGASLLQVAIESNSRQAFRALLELGADPRRKSADGLREIERVVRDGDAALLSIATAAGFAIDPRVDASLLSLAIRRGDVALTRALLAAGIPSTAPDAAGRTPLMHAARAGDPELVKLLLDRGAVVDSSDAAGRTALWYASAAGSSAIVDVLLAVRADPNGASRGEPPLLAAVRAGSEPVVARLLAAGASADDRGNRKKPPLRAAAEAGRPQIVAQLLEHRPQVDAVDEYGDTALMAAARIGDVATCVRLLAAGANPRLRNREHATAAELAEARGFASLAERLRS